mgnify:FL=1
MTEQGLELALDYEFEVGAATLKPEKVPQLNMYTVKATKGSVPDVLSGRYTSLRSLGKAVQDYIDFKEKREETLEIKRHQRKRRQEIQAHIDARAEKAETDGES